MNDRIQAKWFNHERSLGRGDSWTELARVVAHDSWWTVDMQGVVVDANGARVCESIESLARVIFELEWVEHASDQWGSTIAWPQVPDNMDARADLVRQAQNSATWYEGRTPQELLRFAGFTGEEVAAIADAIGTAATSDPTA